ncbi:MAG: threonine/serine exporter family protein [Bacillota bacterium]
MGAAIDSGAGPGEVLKVAAAAGALLLRCGADVARVEDTVARIARAYGIGEAEIYATPTGLFVSLGEQTTVVKRVGERTIALDRVSAINALSRELAARPVPPVEALRRIRAVAEQPSPLPHWLDVPASGLAAAAATMLVGGALSDLLPAFLANLVVQGGQRFTRWLRLPDALSDLIAGASAVACALALNAWLGVRVGPVVAGGIMVLVPGIAFTAAVRDAMAGDLVSAGARGLEAIMKAAALASGVAAALYLFGGGELL